MAAALRSASCKPLQNDDQHLRQLQLNCKSAKLATARASSGQLGAWYETSP